jgi:hypothetical protein
MSVIQMFGTPGHLVSGAIALSGAHAAVPGYLRVATRPRGFVGMGTTNVTDRCRSALERSR